MTKTITHTVHGHEVTATLSAWKAVGATLYADNTLGLGNLPFGMTELLALSLAQGHVGDQALAWAAIEHRRRQEEDSRVRAQRADSNALADLATAIRETCSQEALQRLLSRLSERTADAVRAQLADACV